MREQHLIKKMKKGNTEALNELITSYYPQVYAFLYRKMQMDDHAKDVTQEVFLRFIRYIPTYHHEGKLLHYLYAIASNVCKDHYRSVPKEADIDNMSEMLGDATDVEEETLLKLRNEQLMYYIGQLKDDQQNIIILKYFHQMTFQEIADLYHKPLSTMKSRHTQALIKLREMMNRGELE